MNETDLAELLRETTAEPPPTRLVDLSRAKADGARTLRRRRVGVSIASGLAAVAVLATGAVVVSAIGARHPQPGPALSPPAPTASTAAPDHFDVGRLAVAAGWLPAGLTDQRFQETRADRQILTYQKLGPPDPDGLRPSQELAVVTVYAAGVTPELGPVGIGAPSSAPSAGPTVGGVASTWNAARGVLTWSWAPGGWATVLARGTFDAPASEVAVRIAAGLRTGLDQPVPMPYTVTPPPAPLRLVRTLTARSGDGGFDAQLSFSDRDDETDPVTRIPRMLVVSVSANTSLTGSGKDGAPNTTLDGHPAIVDFDGNAGRALLMGVHGCWVDVYVYDPVTMTYVGRDAAVAMARGITVVPTPADPSTWTTKPIR